MKKRIFHGKVNDVEFNDRDAMVNYVHDLTENGEKIHTFSSYYEMVDTEDPVEDTSDSTNLAINQLDLSEIDIKATVDMYSQQAFEIIENELTTRMSNLMIIFDNISKKSLSDLAPKLKAMLSATAEAIHEVQKLLEADYKKLEEKHSFINDNLDKIEDMFGSAKGIINAIERENRETVLFSRIYENILAWCEAINDIIDDYNSK